MFEDDREAVDEKWSAERSRFGGKDVINLQVHEVLTRSEALDLAEKLKRLAN